MAEFILKDQYGKEQTFDHDKIFVQGTDGELVQFTEGTGEAVLESLEVTENGSYTPGEGVDGFGSVTVNVDPTKITVRKEQEMTGFALDEEFGYCLIENPASFTMALGEKYVIAWDGVTYESSVSDASSFSEGALVLGNGTPLGLSGNDEPFAIGYLNGMIMYLAFTDPAESHTVGIWKKGSTTSNDVRYVTFMSYDGLTEYGKKAVAVGDDCADPIARGIFATPTRESDAQYNYTFYGWATEPNGAADSDWNKSVTEDKTVYANFASAVRYYTITYYDSDGTTVLKTESLAYGTVPSYTPAKSGYDFAGWEQELVPVNGNTSYTATWTEEVNFSTASWERINEIAQNGEAQKHFAVGDEKTVELSGYGTIKVAIAGFEHDDLASGSGKAKITFICTVLPSRTQARGESIKYSSCLVHKNLNETNSNPLIQYFPSDLRNVIKTVNKKIDDSIDSGSTTETVSAKLWALSLSEMGCTHTKTVDLGNKYPIFTAQTVRWKTSIKLPISMTDSQGNAIKGFWLRDLDRVGTTKAFYCIPYSTASFKTDSTTTPTEAYNLGFGFCI